MYKVCWDVKILCEASGINYYVWLINGCFQAKGACIGDVYVASDVAFCDRRIPIPVSAP